MKRLLAVMIIGLLAGGCAHQNKVVWVSPDNRSEQEQKKDLYECVQQSRTSWSGGGSGLLGIAMIAGSQSAASSQATKLGTMCMEAKGYIAREKEQYDQELEKWKEKVSHPGVGFIGVTTNVFPDLKPVILKVTPGSPADKQGIRVGDILAEKDGQKITCAGDFRACTFPKVGEWVEYKVLRGTEELTFKMQAVSRPKEAI